MVSEVEAAKDLVVDSEAAVAVAEVGGVAMEGIWEGGVGAAALVVGSAGAVAAEKKLSSGLWCSEACGEG